MDHELIVLKLSSLQRCISRIEEKRPNSAQALMKNSTLLH